MEEYVNEQQLVEATPDMAEQKEDDMFLAQDNPDAGMISFSNPQPVGGVYALFKEVLDMPDTKKVANLDKTELGNLDLSVRGALSIHLLGETFHHPTFAKFFANQAEIINATSMSKKGWFPELFVTSKKFAQRDTSSSVNLPQTQKSKWGIFSNNQQPK
jgi:hypothetical protein